MKKRIIAKNANFKPFNNRNWLDLEALAEVEITSEKPEFPIEFALLDSVNTGWQASEPGEQTVRLLFNKPQNIESIHLLFEELERTRTQKFLLSWLPEGGEDYREIVRQQYNFSPSGSNKQLEDYTVNLKDVSAIELKINPDLGASNAYATCSQFRLT